MKGRRSLPRLCSSQNRLSCLAIAKGHDRLDSLQQQFALGLGLWSVAARAVLQAETYSGMPLNGIGRRLSTEGGGAKEKKELRMPTIADCPKLYTSQEDV